MGPVGMPKMAQAKFTLSKSQIDFINRHEAFGFPDKSALMREALDQLEARLAHERLVESARVYAEIYAEEKELRDLAEAGLDKIGRLPDTKRNVVEPKNHHNNQVE